MTTATTNDKHDKFINGYGGYILQYLANNMAPKTTPKYGYVIPPTRAGVFGCCGANQISGLSGDYLATDWMRQEMVFSLMFANKQTYYCLATTSQIKTFSDKKTSVLNLLFELGAKEVHVNPNRVHGPNNLHLLVIDPGDPEVKKNVKKFLYPYNFKDRYGYSKELLIPIEAAKELGVYEKAPEVLTVVKKAPKAVKVAVALKKAARPRDALGRFI